MRCKNCGKEIDEFELFCDDCKRELKNISSKKELNELEELIEEQRRLNELEQTKELTNLSVLVEEEINSDKLDEPNEKNINIETKSEELRQEPKTREERNLSQIQEKPKKEKKNKKKLIIIISCILLIAIIVIGLLIFIRKDNKNSKEEIIIDYENIINAYGKSIERTVNKYIEKNNEIPTWMKVTELNKYKKYEVICKTHNIYSDGSIYLNNCKVNDKKTKYSYGQEKQETKEGKKINVYKIDYNDQYYAYSDKNEVGSTLAGTITCKTNICDYIDAYDKYVFIKEDDRYYLYDYKNDSMEFGPFDMSDDYLKNLIIYDHTLYGIYYNEDGINNIYNVNNGKTFKNIKGTLYQDGFYNSSSILYKYNYVVLVNGKVNNFINLKTGNISYSINDTLGDFIEDKNNKLVYMTAYSNSDHSKFKIYNSNGKALFNGKEFKFFKVTDNNLLVASENEYKVYDKKLNLKLSSKKYDEILGLYEDFIVAVKDKHLKILDLNDKELATFDFEWDSNRYHFHNMLSGWYTDNGKYGIYLVIEDKKIPFGTLGSGLEYYYIPNTKETGVIQTPGVGGYAKPVLYLYPQEKTNITVTFEKPNMLTTTYPKFKDKWEVVASPNGDLYDLKGNYYYALYWEEEKNHYIDFSEGFYVTKQDSIQFLEEKLTIIGLNAKERNEFIMYWLPILEKNDKNLVYFELTEERNSYNKLIINPKPDSILRVAMHVKKVNKKTSIKEQHLTSFHRKGYTAVEWGGVIY